MSTVNAVVAVINSMVRFVISTTSSHKGEVISPAVLYNATTVASVGYPAHPANE
jgi:hypothetical protein